ncbi:MAG: SIMPL domain-containing protein [Flavobacteriia bacterium]|nr:SIMPL domain-containing protein [Flavobacteriia bacterium]
MKNKIKILSLFVFFSQNIIVTSQIAGNAIYDNVNLNKKTNPKIVTQISSDNSILLEANVMMNISPTSYTAIFSLAQQGKTASETDSLMKIKMRNIENQLEALGLSKENIKEDMIAFNPTYSYQLDEKKFNKTYNEIPIGFLLKKNLHILFTEHEMMAEIMSILSKNEVYDLVKVDYNLSDLNSHLKQVRLAAQKIIKEKEKDYSEMGIRIEIASITDGYNVITPIERYNNYTAYYNGSTIEEITTAKKKKEKSKDNRTASSNQNLFEDDASFLIKTSEKSKTVFYNKLPYTEYDMVINADHAEPRIQIIYQLKSKYYAQNKEKYDTAIKTNLEQKEIQRLKKEKRKLFR